MVDIKNVDFEIWSENFFENEPHVYYLSSKYSIKIQ